MEINPNEERAVAADEVDSVEGNHPRPSTAEAAENHFRQSTGEVDETNVRPSTVDFVPSIVIEELSDENETAQPESHEQRGLDQDRDPYV